jgi:glyoxylase-like metal-dependent hydrolase (beta-lactamase superfamily II)
MNSGSFRFDLGKFGCVSISDGAFNYPLESFFANVPREQVQETLRQQNLATEQITTPYTLLLVDTGEHRVLVDTGAGSLGAHAAALFPSVDHSTTVTGELLDNLRATGIEPSDIDTVVITHAHPDHVGGTLDEAGNPVFESAHYFVSREEWDFWTSDAAMTKAPPPMVNIARRNLEPSGTG